MLRGADDRVTDLALGRGQRDSFIDVLDADQAGDLRRTGVSVHRLHRSCLQHTAPVDDHDLISQQRGLFRVVSHEDRRQSALALETSQLTA